MRAAAKAGDLLKRSQPRLAALPSLGKLLSLTRDAPLVPVIIFAVVVACGIFAAFIAPSDPVTNDMSRILRPPFWQGGGSLENVLGTDALGRDVLSRMIYGARVSLIVGLTSVFVAGSIGCLLALLAGFFGGWIDDVIMRLTDAMLSLPFLLLALLLVSLFGPGLMNVVFILAFTTWASYARVLRSEVLRLRELDFVRLATVAGCSRPRILAKHIFPNIVNTLVVLGSLQLGLMIIAEASLSFLGMGIRPPTPSWGYMAAEGRQYIMVAWWMISFPGLAIVLLVLAANLFGDWLRFRLDPKYRQL